MGTAVHLPRQGICFALAKKGLFLAAVGWLIHDALTVIDAKLFARRELFKRFVHGTRKQDYIRTLIGGREFTVFSGGCTVALKRLEEEEESENEP